MRNIEVILLNESHTSPAGMMKFLAALTQKGHKIHNAHDLIELYESCIFSTGKVKHIVALPHGSIKRHTPMTVAIVGASRRFLAQARTHSVGIDFVSASLQYSNYADQSDFYVPYELIQKGAAYEEAYLAKCAEAASMYEYFTKSCGINNDTAGYLMPHGLRNILVATANHEAWSYFIRTRACKRNTDETRYIATCIWELLLEHTNDGEEMFAYTGPDCLYGKCREGKMSCKHPIAPVEYCNIASFIKMQDWPLLWGGNDENNN